MREGKEKRESEEERLKEAEGGEELRKRRRWERDLREGLWEEVFQHK